MKSFKELKEKLNNQMMFFIMAIAMVVITIITSVYLLIFLVSNLSQIFTVSVKPTSSQQFDIQGFEKLHLVQ